MSRNRRTSLDDARRRGLSRVAPITAGIVLAGGVVSVSTAVALAATRDAPARTTVNPGGSGSTSAPAGRQPTVAPQPVPQDGGGVAPGGDTPPQGQSHGS